MTLPSKDIEIRLYKMLQTAFGSRVAEALQDNKGRIKAPGSVFSKKDTHAPILSTVHPGTGRQVRVNVIPFSDVLPLPSSPYKEIRCR